MNCRIVRRLVEARDESRLSQGERAALDAHVSACRVCQRLRRREQMLSQWLEELPVAEPAANFEWRLRLRLAQLEHELPALAPVPAGRRRWVLPFALSTAAAAAVVLAVGLGVRGYRDAARGGGVAMAGKASPVGLAPWTPSPPVALGTTWPRLVPVRAGTPLGPELGADAIPSILGEAQADTSQLRRRAEPIDVRPVGW